MFSKKNIQLDKEVTDIQKYFLAKFPRYRKLHGQGHDNKMKSINCNLKRIKLRKVKKED